MLPKRLIAAGLAASVLMVPAGYTLDAGDVQDCASLAETLKSAREDINALQDERDRHATATEDAGIAWQDSAVHRNVSESHAAQADKDKAAYKAAKASLIAAEDALQARVRKLNTGIKRFNSHCATDTSPTRRPE